VTSTNVRITNISQSLPHKKAENSGYEEITSLSPYVYETKVAVHYDLHIEGQRAVGLLYEVKW